MARRSLRDQILRAGLPVLFRCGYHAASVRDICAAAGAPQGSFTNHFRSKEAFAVEVLDQYFDYLKGLVSEALNDETLTPRQRLKRYLDVITDKLERDRWMLGCLIGDFSLQVSSHSRLLCKRSIQSFESGEHCLHRASPQLVAQPLSGLKLSYSKPCSSNREHLQLPSVNVGYTRARQRSLNKSRGSYETDRCV